MNVRKFGGRAVPIQHRNPGCNYTKKNKKKIEELRVRGIHENEILDKWLASLDEYGRVQGEFGRDGEAFVAGTV